MFHQNWIVPAVRLLLWLKYIKKKHFFFFLVFLDGQKSKEELLAAVCKYVFQEIERLMGKLQLFSRNNF